MDYDLLVIGSGSAAFAAGIEARPLGATVALAERGTPGGTCVNLWLHPVQARHAELRGRRAGDVMVRGLAQRSRRFMAGALAEGRAGVTGRPGSSPFRTAAVAGAVAVAVLCCAGPALGAAGALGVIAAALRNPVIGLAGGLLFLSAVSTALFRRRRGARR